MIISTGMGTLEEIEEAVDTVRQQGNNQICLLKCTSAYPSPLTDMNLKTIPDLSRRFQVEVGLSDHSLGAVAPMVAVSLGARVIEKHFCLDRNIPTPDAAFSLEPHEFAHMVRSIRDVEAALGSVTYESKESEKVSLSHRRSIFVVRKIEQGEVFTRENLRIIRPADGLAPKHLKEVLGHNATEAIEPGTPLSWSHLEHKERVK